ncbi:hypothetical protein BIW11_07870 [Tropilaelaps mercedesae]|uniref:Uncharacterized protein n=1 Tax=Tropilaelaps mercedesae TaxID=418985 RepID=A0A1V9XS22_9ACAR|nr:hypothetical protein BIW11_07870 [Tropilaelaps mercedesae]
MSNRYKNEPTQEQHLEHLTRQPSSVTSAAHDRRKGKKRDRDRSLPKQKIETGLPPRIVQGTRESEWVFQAAVSIVLTCYGGVSGVSGVRIVSMQVPRLVRNGTTPSVTLDCIYEHDEAKDRHLVVKWFFNQNRALRAAFVGLLYSAVAERENPSTIYRRPRAFPARVRGPHHLPSASGAFIEYRENEQTLARCYGGRIG